MNSCTELALFEMKLVPRGFHTCRPRALRRRQAHVRQCARIDDDVIIDDDEARGGREGGEEPAVRDRHLAPA